jgi:hypothetical protein
MAFIDQQMEPKVTCVAAGLMAAILMEPKVICAAAGLMAVIDQQTTQWWWS